MADLFFWYNMVLPNNGELFIKVLTKCLIISLILNHDFKDYDVKFYNVAIFY